MAKKSSRRLSEQERAERRRQDRERLQRAAEELLSSDGWARWVRIRAMFHSYSAGHCMLLALQCPERGIVPRRVAGFRAWLKLGRCVRKNEKALTILAPVTVKERDAQGEETGERRVFFKTAFVFELSQTEPLPGAEPVPLDRPCEPLTGDSHGHLLAPLEAFARSLGYAVSFERIGGSVGGWCDPKSKRIVIDADVPANAQLRTLIPETLQALGFLDRDRDFLERLIVTLTRVTPADEERRPLAEAVLSRVEEVAPELAKGATAPSRSRALPTTWNASDGGHPTTSLTHQAQSQSPRRRVSSGARTSSPYSATSDLDF